jgi:hypothetical protein
MEAGRGRGWAKTQHIVIGQIVRQANQTGFQIFGIMEMEKFSPSQLRDGFRSLGMQRAARRQKRHGSQTKRRRQLADAVEHLLAVVAIVFGVSSLTAEAAVRRARSVVGELPGLMRNRCVRTGKAEALHRGIGIADQPQRFVQIRLASLVNGFAK